jgi:S-methylmethionine-dependent homocysteine/selenocysteine methylase
LTAVEHLNQRLAEDGIVIVDGGMGSELQARGVPMDSEAWSGVANLESIDAVREIHEDYIRAGADVIIANTYAAARFPLTNAGYADRVVEANRNAVEAAKQARENAAGGRPVAIAGSLSLTAAMDVILRGKPAPQGEQLLADYREQAETIASTGADLIALEMISDASYGRPAIQAALETGLPVWLGISVNPAENGRVPMLGSQEGYLDDLLDELLTPELAAVGIMHSVVEAVNPALDVIRSKWEGAIVAYPHVGDYKPPTWIFGDITPEAFADEARTWVDHGARIVGGCCGIRPEHIAVLARELGGARTGASA